MTVEGLAELLAGTGLPVAYRAWPEEDEGKPPMPYLCYREREIHTLRADGVVYHTWGTYEVLLYTALKAPGLEKQVEAALRELHWTKDEHYIDAERCYVITYEIEV